MSHIVLTATIDAATLPEEEQRPLPYPDLGGLNLAGRIEALKEYLTESELRVERIRSLIETTREQSEFATKKRRDYVTAELLNRRVLDLAVVMGVLERDPSLDKARAALALEEAALRRQGLTRLRERLLPIQEAAHLLAGLLESEFGRDGARRTERILGIQPRDLRPPPDLWFRTHVMAQNLDWQVEKLDLELAKLAGQEAPQAGEAELQEAPLEPADMTTETTTT